MKSSFKKTNVKLDLLMDIDMLKKKKKVTSGGICHSIYPYAKGNNKFMENYDKNKDLSYIQ